MAQETDTTPVRASVEASVSLTRIAGEAEVLVGGAAFLHVTRRLSVGGFGAVSGGEVTLSQAPGLGRSLDVGYGGVAVGFTPRPTTGPDAGPVVWGVHLLAGAGNAELRDSASGTRLGSDNFALLSPELLARRTLLGRLSATASLGYRLVFGIEDLQDVDASDLQGFSLSLSLTLGPL